MRALILTLFLSAPAFGDTADAVANHIRPGHAAFALAADALAALETCEPAVLRPVFQATWDSWLEVAHLRLGPAEEDGRSLAIHFWPDPKGLGWKAQRALLTADPDALTPANLAQQSVAARGLAGLERLIYPREALPADPCPLIQATADDMARQAAEMADGWIAYGDLLLTAGQPANTTYLSQAEARQALFTQLATGLEAVADTRLGRPLGTFDRPRPDLAEAHAAGRSLRNVILSLQALRDLAQALDPESPATLAAFDHALTLAQDLNDPVLAGIADPQGRLKVEILQQAIRSARAAAIAEMAPALGVTLGFNSADGD